VSHATAYDFSSASIEPRQVRALYKLREKLEPLRRRLVADRFPKDSLLTGANSASPLIQKLVYTLVDSDPARDSWIEYQHTGEPGAIAEAVGTVSETISAVTTTQVLDRAIAQNIESLLTIARDEHFEDGMNSNLSVGLQVLFRNFSAEFARVLGERLTKGGISARILAEMFYALGQIEDDNTKDWRMATLVDFLKSPSPVVRDAAAVGLAYLDDKRAAPYLREAMDRESSETLKEDIRAVVEQLTA